MVTMLPVSHELHPGIDDVHVEPNFMQKEVSLRRSFSVKEKREYVVAVDAIIATGATRRQACAMVNLPHNY